MEWLRRCPVGAELVPGKGVDFRVWAPDSKRVAVEFAEARGQSQHWLEAEGGGYHNGLISGVGAGERYWFRLEQGKFPDPASRFQPEGVHGPSQIIDPERFGWTDLNWPGMVRKGQILYEMHVGTFTPRGTWSAAAARLADLAELGVTAIQLMPVAEFPGRFGWGYDGVYWFAPTHLYGTPDDFRAFVNRAHSLHLAVILDVVYNHLGPSGSCLSQFSSSYLSRSKTTDWGDALNLDQRDCQPVRELALSNAGYWIKEFHLDGLRLDAIDQIFDESSEHLVFGLAQSVRAAAAPNSTFLVGEAQPQNTKWIRAPHSVALDALFNEDFHHSSRVALTGRREAYYSRFNGCAQELLAAAKAGFLFQKQSPASRSELHENSTWGLSPERFVQFLQNHDQIANSLHGARIHQLAAPAMVRALTAYLLLAPGTPLLFQGQEFAASTPFLYFADHPDPLASQVAQGRRQFLCQFASIAAESDFLAPPEDVVTFLRSKLRWRERKKNTAALQLHRDLLHLRRRDPVFAGGGPVDGAVLGNHSFVLRYFGKNSDRLLLLNLGTDLEFNPAVEPLLAPRSGEAWQVQWSSEAPIYGGSGNPAWLNRAPWKIIGQSVTVLRGIRIANPKLEAEV